MRAIIVTGMPGAGKEELLQVAASKGIPAVRMGDMVRKAYSESGMSDRMSLGEFASDQRARFGKDVWAKRTIEEMEGDVILVDGCRSMDEVGSFRRLADDAPILAVMAPPEVRFQRLVQRGREDAPSDRAEFEERDRREIGWGIAEVIAMSDRVIPNDGSLEEFKARASEALEGLI